MSFPKHENYKGSGVRWIGKVPDHWKVTPIRLAARLESGHTPSRLKPEYWEDCEVPWFTLGDVWQIRDGLTDVVTETKEKVSELGLANSAARLLPKGTVILSRTASVGFSAIMGIDMATTQDFANWVCGPNLTPEYLLHVFRAMGGEFERLRMGSTHDTIYMPDIRSMRCPLPPLDEQRAIASFLDLETSKIDGLVSEQRRLIELLKEKRQAVISHAVTKGLNPNAPMKPSGIPWLGDVPEHWSLKPLKYLATFRSGGTPSKTVPEYWHGDIPWASSKDLKTETLADTIDHITQCALDCDEATLVPAGSVLVVVRGMILLHTFPVVQTLVPMAINQDLKALTPAECIDISYLPWLLRGSTSATFGRVDEAAHGTKVLRMEAWASIHLPVPPIDEQHEIVQAIEKQLETLSQLQTEAERAIELLQERRTALISAAVTGKIDLRSDVNLGNI
jgi:type I restriction enzyme S subunit